ncbi:hypothetical protein ACVWXM_009694 [Bradyrhizobium sp. GM7.3]
MEALPGNLDYHVEIAQHHYSVSHDLVSGGRDSHHPKDHRDFPARQAGGLASAQHPAASPDHDRRAYADSASAGPMRIRSEVAKAGLDVTAPNNRPLIRRSTNAKLRQAATIENVGYRTACGLDRPLFQTLAIGEGSDHNHLMIVGPNGTGKSWLACGPATKRAATASPPLQARVPPACRSRQAPRRPPRLPDRRAGARQSQVLDEWGPEPLTALQRWRSSMIATTRDHC